MLKRVSVAAALIACCCAGSPLPAAGPVTTADYAWLAGSWEGKVAAFPSATAEVTFQPPNAGLITGVMRLVNDGKIAVVELISLVDTPGGLELRFRHFSPRLEAYEKEFKQTMQLTNHEPGTDTFTNAVPYQKELPSTQPRVTKWIRRSPDEFVGHSDIIGDDGKAAVIESTYRRVH
jgi:hypothetical protein